MRFPDRLAFTHPLWFLVLLVVVFAVGLVAAAEPRGSSVPLTLGLSYAGVLFPLLWAHGIHNLAARAGGRPSKGAVFVAVEILIVLSAVIGVLSGEEGRRGVLAGVIVLPVLGYFLCLWLAAGALARAESATDRSELAPTLGTFLLMVYWMIGAWFIRPRVGRLGGKVDPFPTAA